MIALRRSVRGFSLTELMVVLAIAATLMAVGTPVLRGAMNEQRLKAGAIDILNAMAEAKRQAVRIGEATRIEVDPTDGRISVFTRNINAVNNNEIEARRSYLPTGVVFDGLQVITSYTFDTLGRPATLPMSIGVRSTTTNALRTVTVLGSGQMDIN